MYHSMLWKKKLLVLLFLFAFFVSFSEETRNDTIEPYFNRIEHLLNDKKRVQNYFQFQQDLLLKYSKVQGEEKVNLLFQLYYFNKFKDSEKANLYNDEALMISKTIGYTGGELQGRYNKSYMYFMKGLFKESLGLIEKIYSVNRLRDDYPNVYADAICLKSVIHSERGEYDIALELALLLLDVGEKDKDDYTLMKAHGALLHFYLRTENYSKALHHCLKGIDYTIKLNEIIYLYFKVDEIARILANLGDINGALDAYDFYLKIEDKIGTQGGYIHSIVYMNMADIFIASEALGKAQDYLSKALSICYENNYRFRIPRALIIQAEIYLRRQDTIQAIEFYEKSLKAAEDINAFFVVKSNSQILSKLYKETNQLSQAQEYKALHDVIRDSLFTNEKEQKIVILEAKRKIREITQVQKILELENDAQKTEIRFIIILLVLVICISTILTVSYVKVRNKNKFLYQKTIDLAKIELDKSQNYSETTDAKTKTKTGLEKNIKLNKEIDDNVKYIILKKLQKLEEEQFFINQNCTLNDIAKELKTNPKYLSQVINQEKNSNFSNYVNELRINYLLGRLIKEKDFRENKLSYIAACGGYNNLNTFNSAFKKRQGILPSYFISQLIQEMDAKQKDM